jgi:hypothetical protein
MLLLLLKLTVNMLPSPGGCMAAQACSVMGLLLCFLLLPPRVYMPRLHSLKHVW